MEKMGDGSGFSVAVKRGATAFVGFLSILFVFLSLVTKF